MSKSRSERLGTGPVNPKHTNGEWFWPRSQDGASLKQPFEIGYQPERPLTEGDSIDFMLSPKRDLIAATMFLRLELSAGGPWPRVINVDGHPAYTSAVAELK